MKMNVYCALVSLSVFGVALCSCGSNSIPATSIELSAEELNLYEGESRYLTATVLPSNTTDKTVTWSVAPAGFATVDQNGMVSAINKGSCVVTATTSNGLTDTCNVYISPVASDDINITKDAGLDFSSGTGSVTVKDGRDVNVVFNYSAASNVPNNLVALSEGGTFVNKAAIKGVTEVKAIFTGKLFLKYAYITSDYTELEELTSGVSFTLKKSRRANYIELVAGEGGAVIESLFYQVNGSINNPFDGTGAWDQSNDTLVLQNTDNWERGTTYYSIPEKNFADNFAIEWTLMNDPVKYPTDAPTSMSGVLLADETGTQMVAGTHSSGNYYSVTFCDANSWKPATWKTRDDKSNEAPIDGKTTYRLERYIIEGQNRAFYKFIVNGNEYTYLGSDCSLTRYDEGLPEGGTYKNVTLSGSTIRPIVSVGFGCENEETITIGDIKYEVLDAVNINTDLHDFGAHSVNYAAGESSAYFFNSGDWFDNTLHRGLGLSNEDVTEGLSLDVGDKVVIEADIVRTSNDSSEATLQNNGGWNDPHGLLIKEGTFDNVAVFDDSQCHKVFAGIKSQEGGKVATWGTNSTGSVDTSKWDYDHKLTALYEGTTAFKYKDIYSRKEQTAQRVRWEVTTDAENYLYITMLLQNKAGEWVAEFSNLKTVKTFDTMSFYLSANGTMTVYFHDITAQLIKGSN